MDNSLTLLGGGSPVQSHRRIPNSIIFPKELRDAIPTHSARALQFDRVSASISAPLALACLANPDWLKASGYDISSPRVRLSFLAHETGQLSGEYEIGLDFDAETLRALGEFLVTLADRADSSL
jgi:hypothetical protein